MRRDKLAAFVNQPPRPILSLRKRLAKKLGLHDEMAARAFESEGGKGDQSSGVFEVVHAIEDGRALILERDMIVLRPLTPSGSKWDVHVQLEKAEKTGVTLQDVLAEKQVREVFAEDRKERLKDPLLRKELERPDLTCPNCHRAFINRTGWKNKKYCSRKCNLRASRQRTRDRQRERVLVRVVAAAEQSAQLHLSRRERLSWIAKRAGVSENLVARAVTKRKIGI